MTHSDSMAAAQEQARLSALRATGLLDSGPEESFDRLTRLAARLLGAPMALVSLVDEDRDFYKSQHGLPEPLATRCQLSGSSFCRQVVASRAPLVVGDSRSQRESPAAEGLEPLGAVAYAGVPLRTREGFVLGSFCVLADEPREWTEADMEVLSELAASAEREIQLRSSLWESAQRAEESQALIEQLQSQAAQLENQAIELEMQVEAAGQLNAALADSEQRFRALAEADPDGIVTIDDHSIILSANPALGRIFGYEEEELLGKSLEVLMPERFRQAHAHGTTRYRQTGQRNISWRGVQIFGVRKDGTEIPVEINFGEYTANGRHIFAGFISDITQRRQAEEALKEAKDAAERASEAKSEFLSRMSHELRTPMNSILGFGQLLARLDLPEEHARWVDHILKGGRHLLNLINEVLEISRIEANEQQFSLESVPARAVISEALALIRPTAQQASIRLLFTEPALAEVCVRADQQRLMQVMLNLLSNAIKYNSRNGIVEVVTHQRGTLGSGGKLAIGVRDTGPGIPADRMHEIFVPFSRLDAEQAGIEGTGLGLVLSRRLVEAMGGELRVESREGEGSTFWVELPLADDPRRALDAQPDQLTVETLLGQGPKTVLYVEDNLANLDLVQSILRSRPDIMLLPALQGRVGLQLAREHNPDLILLDLHLPDLPGEEVLRQLAADERTRGIPVLVISADATRRQVERLRAAGAQDYLTKPLNVPQFLAAVDAGLAPG